jgi:SAM-dependent methyltransferase
LKLDLSDTTYVEGDLKNIPLRANYVDLLIVTDMPKNEDIEGATEERHRVVKNDGRIAVLSPNVLFGRFEDPLAIVDFMGTSNLRRQKTWRRRDSSEVPQETLPKRGRK